MVHNFPKGLSTFYISVYKLVDDPSTDSIISWSKSNQSFIFWRPEEFNRRFLGSAGFLCYDYKEFIVDLKFYGFDRIAREPWEFGHEDFVRGQPERLKKLMLKGGRRRREATRANEKAKAKAKQAENRLRQLRI
ncbi:Heat shock factor protein HSF8 [Cardamine amara subsp. amara]|uniref:Heat shock factor protein HSF8 n=1 Tax=Cardamine amara subsp. amara TaxID=228776 RepID=A0ABD1APG8_CARAN